VYISMPSDIMRMRLPFCALGLMISGGMFLAITTIDPKEQVRGGTGGPGSGRGGGRTRCR
jgi:hypothetical protein